MLQCPLCGPLQLTLLYEFVFIFVCGCACTYLDAHEEDLLMFVNNELLSKQTPVLLLVAYFTLRFSLFRYFDISTFP